MRFDIKTDQPILEAQGVSYSAGACTLIDDVSLALRPGVLLALVGPIGAGTTTLLRLLAGYLSPASGQVLLGGRPLASIGAREQARTRAVLRQQLNVAFESIHSVVAA